MRRSLPGSRPLAWIACAALVILFVAPSVYGKSQSDKHSKDVVFEEEFPLGTNGNLLVDVEDMDVYLETKGGGSTNIVVHISGRDRDDANEYFDKMRFEVLLDGKTLEINSRDPEHEGWNTWFGSRHPRVWIVVTLPKETNIEIKTEDGDVRIDDIDGNAFIYTEDGDVEIMNIRGDSIELRSEDGDVDVESLQGADISVRTEDGDIRIDDTKAESVNLFTEDGDVALSQVASRSTSIESEDGDLDITVSGDRLEISCADGDVSVALLSAMEIDIEVDDGNVDLTLPKDTGFDLDLGGGDVTIRSKLSVEGRVSDDVLRGSVNGGGPLVRVTGSDSSIVIHEK